MVLMSSHVYPDYDGVQRGDDGGYIVGEGYGKEGRDKWVEDYGGETDVEEAGSQGGEDGTEGQGGDGEGGVEGGMEDNAEKAVGMEEEGEGGDGMVREWERLPSDGGHTEGGLWDHEGSGSNLGDEKP